MASGAHRPVVRRQVAVTRLGVEGRGDMRSLILLVVRLLTGVAVVIATTITETIGIADTEVATDGHGVPAEGERNRIIGTLRQI